MLRRIRGAPVLLVVLVAALTLGACGDKAKTPLGKATQGVYFQKELVVGVASAVKGRCLRNEMGRPQCAQAEDAYTKWWSAEMKVAETLAKAKEVSQLPDDQKMQAALADAQQLAGSYIGLMQQLAPGLVDQIKAKLNLPKPASGLARPERTVLA
jgi:hypothetical protein